MKYFLIILLQLIVFFKVQCQNIGINNPTPEATLDINGKIIIKDDINLPVNGAIRWNELVNDFEGYNGHAWISLTKDKRGWGQKSIYEDYSILSIGTPGNLGTCSMDIEGNVLVIGKPFLNNNNYSQTGKVFVYKKISENWELDTILFNSNGMNEYKFGYKVSIKNNIILVSEIGSDEGGIENKGKVYSYKLNNSVWEEIPFNNPQTLSNFSQFGFSLKQENNYAIVSAPVNQTFGTAFLYELVNNTWVIIDTLFPQENIVHNFGSEVEFSKNTIAIGTTYGVIYIFKKNNGVWNYESYISSPDSLSLSFGYNISLYDNRLFVSDPSFDSSKGLIYSYLENGNGWQNDSVLKPTSLKNYDWFGEKCLIKKDYAISTARLHDTNGKFNQGKLILFRLVNNVWQEELDIESSDGKAEDYFGDEIGLTDDIIVVTAPGYDTNIQNIGKVYLYKK